MTKNWTDVDWHSPTATWVTSRWLVSRRCSTIEHCSRIREWENPSSLTCDGISNKNLALNVNPTADESSAGLSVKAYGFVTRSKLKKSEILYQHQISGDWQIVFWSSSKLLTTLETSTFRQMPRKSNHEVLRGVNETPAQSYSSSENHPGWQKPISENVKHHHS